MPEKKNRIYWALSDSYVLTKRSILHITRSFDQLLSAALFPIMFLLLFRYVLGGAINTGSVSYVNYLIAGIFVQTLAFGANSTTMNLAIDMQKGVVDRFRSLPMANSSFLIGHIIADLVRNMISAFIILGVGLLVGFMPTATPVEWLFVFGMALLFTFAVSWMSAVLGLLVKSVEAAQWIGFVIIFPLTFASSAFVPTDTMPGALRFFAENQPVTQVVSAIRGWLVGTPAGNSGILAVAWLVGIIIVAIPVSGWLFRRQER